MEVIEDKAVLNPYFLQSYDISMACYSMKLLYRRLIHILLTTAQVSNCSKMECTFPVVNLGKLLSKGNYEEGGKFYKPFRLDSFSDEIMSLTLTVHDPQKTGAWYKWQWVDHCRYDPSSDTLTLRLSSDLAPLVLAYKERFTCIFLNDIKLFSTPPAWRIYELVYTQEFHAGKKGNSKNNFWVKISLSELRSFLSIDKDTYPVTKDFNYNIVVKAIKEINSIDCGIFVTPKAIKESRNIVAYRFDCTSYGPGIGPKPGTILTPEEEADNLLVDAHEELYREIIEELESEEQKEMLDPGAAMFSRFEIRKKAVRLLKERIS
jgi:hypothetical protein